MEKMIDYFRIIAFILLCVLTLFGIKFLKNITGKYFAWVFGCLVSILLLVGPFSPLAVLSKRFIFINNAPIAYSRIIIWLIFLIFPILAVIDISNKLYGRKKYVFVFGLGVVILSLLIQVTSSYSAVR